MEICHGARMKGVYRTGNTRKRFETVRDFFRTGHRRWIRAVREVFYSPIFLKYLPLNRLYEMEVFTHGKHSLKDRTNYGGSFQSRTVKKGTSPYTLRIPSRRRTESPLPTTEELVSNGPDRTAAYSRTGYARSTSIISCLHRRKSYRLLSRSPSLISGVPLLTDGRSLFP